MTAFTIFVVLMVIFGVARKIGKAADPAKRHERMQRLVERMEARQAGNHPQMMQGQYSGPMQGQQPAPGQFLVPGQYPHGQFPVPGQHPVQGQFPAQVGYVAPVQAQYPPPGQWHPAPPAPPFQQQSQQYQPQQHQRADRTQHGRQPEHNFPAPNSPLERRVRELMTSGHEVPAIRLLCDEQDLGIIEAQKYARDLVAPPAKASRGGAAGDDAADENERYVGSAAFAESVFDLDRDEDVWASGWVEKPEPEDRTDMDELWQSVRNAGRPANPAG